MKKNETTAKLQVENRRMDERLQVLRKMMNAEKARRELEGGIHWQSGKSLQVANKQTSAHYNSPHSKKHPLRNFSKGSIKVRILSDKNTGELGSEQKSCLPQCGQCEKTSASLSCVECIENYCQLCFTKMHQKGALSKHHVKPILKKVKHVSPKKSAVISAAMKPASNGLCTKPPQSLLEGTYDEASSAKSFQEALAEWRSGGSVAASNIYSKKDCQTEVKSKVSTVTGGTQVGVGSIVNNSKPVVNINFTDKNGMTYFEKIMIQKCRDGLMVNAKSNISAKHIEMEEDEDEHEPVISQYNIFYNKEDFTHGNLDTAGVKEEVIFHDCSIESGVDIKEVTYSDENLPLIESNVSVPLTHQKKETMEKVENPKLIKIETKRKTTKKLRADNNPKMKSKKLKQSKLCDKELHPHQLKQSDLSASIKNAWSNCNQLGQNDWKLAHFFLHGVNPVVNEPVTKLTGLQTPSNVSQFKLGSVVWLPNSSTAAHHNTHEVTKLEDTLHPNPHNKDHYYNETSSDSEPENEREVFPNSQLNTDYSMETRSSSACQDLEKAEQLERDQEDCNALEDLAWELASTVECEGRLTRCENELDQLDLNVNSEEYSTISGYMEEWSGDNLKEIDMSKVISEFEIYQKELIEEDSC